MFLRLARKIMLKFLEELSNCPEQNRSVPSAMTQWLKVHSVEGSFSIHFLINYIPISFIRIILRFSNALKML